MDEPSNFTDRSAYQHPAARVKDLTVPCSSLVSLFGAPKAWVGSHTTFPSRAWNVYKLNMLCYEAVGYDVFLFVLVRTVRIGIVIHIKSSLTKETVCGTTASQVMRCVSWEGSNPDNRVDTANPKTSASQSPLKGIFFLQDFFRDLSLHLSLFYISQTKNLIVVGLVAVLALPDEVGFLLGFGGSHSLPQARHAHQQQQSPDPQFQFPSLFCWNVHCYTL